MTLEELTPEHLQLIFNSYPFKKNSKTTNNSWKKILFKTYPRLEKIKLKSSLNGELKTLLSKRRSKRKFEKSISLEQISDLLYGASITSGKGDNSRRAYPSGGARYPLEVYLLVKKSELPVGLYHFNVLENCLESIPTIHTEPSKNIFSQSDFSGASIVILITSVIGRSQIKYGLKSLKLFFLESGHLCQNILLLATKLNINACPIAGYNGFDLHKIIQIDGNSESMVYAIALG